MPGREENLRSELVARVAGLALTRLGPERGRDAAGFIKAFYANVAPDDLIGRSADDLYGAGVALWQFGRERVPGRPKVRVYNPRLAEHGWTSRHTVIEIVNDDMPFLVDSVTAELNRRDLTVHLVIHPILRPVRDQAGLASGLSSDPKAPAESFMHVEVDEQGGAEALDAIRQGIEGVLADVRRAVADWRAMRERAAEVIADLSAKPPPVPQAETEVALRFLRWIAADNFTLLGYREYLFEGGGSAARTTIVPDRGLGLCRDDGYVVFDGLRNLSAMPPEVRDFVRRPILLRVTKANRRSTVHRRAYLDAIGVKTFGPDGQVNGERLFLGLFTSTAYSQRPRDIPLLADKVAGVISRAGFDPASHDGKALLHILETYPRDELFQSTEEELYETALGILRLQERQRIALFVRRDSFERFVSALVFVPRDRFDTDLRQRFHRIIARAYGGRMSAFYVQLADDSVLVRIHFIVGTVPGKVPDVHVEDLERELVEAGRSFADRLKDALVAELGEERGLRLYRRYSPGFPTAYRERFAPEAAVADIAKIEAALADPATLGVSLYRAVDAGEGEVSLRLYALERPLPLSDVLPMLENMGLRVLSETPYRIAVNGGAAESRIAWIHDFSLLLRGPSARELDVSRAKAPFEEALQRAWAGSVENDGFNRLVLGAGLVAREVVILRAYAKYLRQAAVPFSQAYMEDALAAYPRVARLLVDLFAAQFDPARRDGAEKRAEAICADIEREFDAVQNLDQDRILRRFLNAVRATLRTNAYQRGADGAPKPWLSFKLDSRAVEGLPLPRPHAEIWVYSPQVEAVHLRGGKVARGGIRWSDRREDFRTEILGLMKAQMVKNAVIVPVGSKGGFFVKRPPPAAAGREAAIAEGVACYQTMMRGLLDLTDNLSPQGVVPPADVVRRDGDDAYLVVAADKGTATFSDIANGISREFGFWLDDAFASGGSAGYDHKGMGITARGAWEAVKRHFRELGHDTQTKDFTVVGVGDMSGDVFGNGMLRSRHIKLIAAFDHRHIFVDPEPDPAASFAERERLFKLARSSWADYDRKLISAGGGVFERSAKSVRLSPEIRARFDVVAESVTPAELMQALLRGRCDLLWFGGIGTFVKASGEANADIGDRANDAVRVNGRELRALVVGEGANLGVTQRGRVEYARTGAGGRGGRINTDAIDNSAGVDTSDHEVNIKILLGDVVARGDMTVKQRNELLARMTDEVGELVLRDNYLQTQALSLAEAEGPSALDRHARLIRALEKSGRLNRAIEFLPDDEDLARRQMAGEGLTRPELAVLMGYAKLALYDLLLPSDLPDDKRLAEDLVKYFPRPLRRGQREAISRHRLRREIIATAVTNSIVNRAGITFVNDVAERTGAAAADIARAYVVVREGFGLKAFWGGVETLDGKVPAPVQYRLLRESMALVERATLWLLATTKPPIDISAAIARYAPGVKTLREKLPVLLDPARAKALAERAAALAAEGVPDALAREAAGMDSLGAALRLAQIVEAAAPAVPIEEAARLHFAIGERVGFVWLRERARSVKAETAWQKRALEAIIDDLLVQQADLTRRAAANGLAGGIEDWSAARAAALKRVDALMAELKMAPALDLAALTVAGRELRAVFGVE